MEIRNPTGPLAVLLLLPLAATPAQAPPRPAPDPTAQRCLEEAIARVQRGIVRSLAIRADHSTWENAWQVPSDHYVVRTTASWQLGRDVGRGLDVMFDWFCKILRPGFETQSRLPVFILPDVPTYNQFGEQHGEHHSSFYPSFYSATHPEKPVLALYSGNETALHMRVAHSALLQFLDHSFPGSTPPACVSMGLASYFSYYWDYRYGVSELGGLCDSERFVPLRDLLAAPLDRYGDRTHRRLVELGMLFNYLLHHREDTRIVTGEDGVERGPFRDYLRTVLRGGDVTGHPVHALVTTRLDELERDFRAFEFPPPDGAR
jgi:hypothetical protein